MQTTAVYYDSAVSGTGTHRVVTSSTLFSGYDGDRSQLQDAFLDVLSPHGDIEFLRADANGDASVDIGDPVQKDQVLAVLDKEPYELEVQKAQAELTTARATLANETAEFERAEPTLEMVGS